MNKLTGLLATSLLITMMGSSVLADSKEELLDECFASIEEGDMERLAEIAREVQSWKFIFSPDLKTKGTECLSQILNEEWVYSAKSGTFIGQSEQQAERDSIAQSAAQAEIRRKREDELYCLRAKISQFAELHDKIVQQQASSNSVEAELAVKDACINYYETDRNAALTNAVCSEIFINEGLPDTATTGVVMETQAQLLLAMAILGRRLVELEPEIQPFELESSSDLMKDIMDPEGACKD